MAIRLEVACREAQAELKRLDKIINAPPEMPKEASEVRSFVRAMSDERARAYFVEQQIVAGDHEVVGAILGSRGWLSGLSASEVERLTERWRQSRFPEELRRRQAVLDATARAQAALKAEHAA